MKNELLLYGLLITLLGNLLACKNERELSLKDDRVQEQIPKTEMTRRISSSQEVTKIENGLIGDKVAKARDKKIITHPLNEWMSEVEIANTYFILDTEDYDSLLGTLDEWDGQFLMICSASYGNSKLENVFRLDDSLCIIPFFIDKYREEQIFTRWKINTDSMFSYARSLNPVLSLLTCHHT